MSNLHLFLSFFEFVPLGIFAVCVLWNYDKPWNFVVRVSVAISLIIINVVQMIMEIQMEKSFLLSVAMISIWVMMLFTYYLRSKKGNFKSK